MIAAAVALATMSIASQAAAHPRRLAYLLRDTTTTGFDGGSTQGTIHGSLKTMAGDVVGTFDAFLVATVVPSGQGMPFTALFNATATFADGGIVANGTAQLNDSNQRSFVLAVTGGTGRYRAATGVVRVKPDQSTMDLEATVVYLIAH
jgi:hypothetical protein